LKKSNKKLLLFLPSHRFKWANQVVLVTGKSFLFLFFKKRNCFLCACLPVSVSCFERWLV